MKLPGVPTGSVNTITPAGRVRWSPKSELTLIASQSEAERGLPRVVVGNPGPKDAQVAWRSKPAAKASARLFVGYNVGDEPVWRSGEVYLLAFLLREKQLATNSNIHPAFSFYAGIGAYGPGTGLPVSSEKSAQIVFLNFDQKQETFFDQIIELAAMMAAQLNQESVMVELSRKGSGFYTDLIYADPEYAATVAQTRRYLNENAERIGAEVFEMK